MSREHIERAASDLSEALAQASDGDVRVDETTLQSVVKLLLHGSDSGEFFDGFRGLFESPVAQYVVRTNEKPDLEDLRSALSNRFPGRQVSFVLADPRGVYVVNLTDPLRSNELRAQVVDGAVSIDG